MINSLLTYSITFPVSMGNIKFNEFSIIYFTKELVHACYRSGAIHIVVAKYHNSFFSCNSANDSLNCFSHILHKVRVM